MTPQDASAAADTAALFGYDGSVAGRNHKPPLSAHPPKQDDSAQVYAILSSGKLSTSCRRGASASPLQLPLPFSATALEPPPSAQSRPEACQRILQARRVGAGVRRSILKSNLPTSCRPGISDSPVLLRSASAADLLGYVSATASPHLILYTNVLFTLRK